MKLILVRYLNIQTGKDNFHYAYNANGEITAKNATYYAYDGIGRLIKAGSREFYYDKAGNNLGRQSVYPFVTKTKQIV